MYYSGEALSGIFLNWTVSIGAKSTTNTSFSFGSRITSELSEWLRPRKLSSIVVPPCVRVLFINYLIGNYDVRQKRVLLLQFEQALLGAPVRNKGCA
jgi:hypothetical protein